MAHSPATRPDPFEPRERDEAAGQPDSASDTPPTRSLSQYLHVLADAGSPSVSTEIALDLVLNEILQAACAATGASAGAIALARNDEMVCRATTGENAPDLGSRLNMGQSLSGTCVRTGKWQRCNDTENDPRVDAAICRRLGVRSIVVVPVAGAEKPLGVIEVFSVRPNAFSDRQLESLEQFSWEIAENVRRAAGGPAANAEPAADSPIPQSFEPATSTAESIPTAAKVQPQVHDFATTALLICVILLALILGWLVGRSHWGRVATSPAAPATHAAPTVPQSSSNSPAISSIEQPAPATVPSQPGEDTADQDGGLVISHNGKVIFRSPASPANESVSATPVGPEKAPIRIPPQIALEYLITRVEPQYPEEARRRRIQGPVTLDALVGEDGAVQKTTRISGNSQLASAASQAVQQWRFQPFLHDGQPQEFRTRITVMFRLP